MITIYKYSLIDEDTKVLTTTPIVRMPKGAEILWVRTQKATPFIWARVDTKAPEQFVEFAIIGTGHNARNVATDKHVGSFFYPMVDNATEDGHGCLVLHLFEIARRDISASAKVLPIGGDNEKTQ